MYPTDDTTDGALGGFGSCLIIHSREVPPNALLNTAARTHVTAELKLENPQPRSRGSTPGSPRWPVLTTRDSLALEPVPPCTKLQRTEHHQDRMWGHLTPLGDEGRRTQ